VRRMPKTETDRHKERQVSVRVKPHVFEWLLKRAKDEDRSVSKTAARVLQQHSEQPEA
jgi:hypothetical protein